MIRVFHPNLKPFRCEYWLETNGFELVNPGSPYHTWIKSYWNRSAHMDHEIRVMEDDHGYDLIIASCCSSYSGDREKWHGNCLGRISCIQPIEMAISLLNLMNPEPNIDVQGASSGTQVSP